MGLLFALDPDPRNSRPGRLLLRSSHKKFGLGMGLILGGSFLGTMFFAAKPLFDKFISEGIWFDKAVAYFFYGTVFFYPLAAALCFLYEEQVLLEEKSPGQFRLQKFKKILFFRWGRKQIENFKLAQMRISNWIGSINTAAVRAKQEGRKDQYSTRGHWLLEIPKNEQDETAIEVIERRARVDDIEWLKARIEDYFDKDKTTDMSTLRDRWPKAPLA